MPLGPQPTGPQSPGAPRTFHIYLKGRKLQCLIFQVQEEKTLESSREAGEATSPACAKSLPTLRPSQPPPPQRAITRRAPGAGSPAPVHREATAQLAQDFRFSGFLWLLSALAKAAVREARLVAEPERVALRRASGAPCGRSPALHRRPVLGTLRTRLGLTSRP